MEKQIFGCLENYYKQQKLKMRTHYTNNSPLSNISDDSNFISDYKDVTTHNKNNGKRIRISQVKFIIVKNLKITSILEVKLI